MALFSNSPAHSMTEQWLNGPQETQFYTRTYVSSSASPRSLVVFIHGFNEHVGRHAHLHPLLAQNGVAIFCFDQRGFGRTALDKEKRSKKSSSGKTGWSDQMQDVDWAIRTAKKQFPGIPVFLMGHSMGGGEVLSFVVQQSYHSPQYAETVASLAGVIVTSPLILQTIPASKVARWLGGKAAIVTPYTLVPAPVNADDLSHSPEMNQAYSKDPLIKSTGSLRGIGDMLTEGEKLLSIGCHHWPRKLPVLFVHGDADKVTSVKATQTFYEEVDAEDKKIILYPNGFHELHNELPPVRRKLVADVVSFIQARIPVHEAKENPQPSQSSQPTLTVPAPQVQLSITTNSEGENSSDNSGSTSRSSTPTSVEPDPTIKRSPEAPTPTTNPSSRL